MRYPIHFPDCVGFKGALTKYRPRRMSGESSADPVAKESVAGRKKRGGEDLTRKERAKKRKEEEEGRKRKEAEEERAREASQETFAGGEGGNRTLVFPEGAFLPFPVDTEMGSIEMLQKKRDD